MLLFKQVEIPDFDLGVDFVDTLKYYVIIYKNIVCINKNLLGNIWYNLTVKY